MAWHLEHILRDSNEKADALAVVVASLPIKEIVLLPVYYQPDSLITASQVNELDKACPFWMTPIVCDLSSGELSDNRAKAHKTQVQAARFSLVNGQLYKRSLDGLYLKCLTYQQEQYILEKLYDGVCGNHPSGKTLAHKSHTQGYYWPTMRVDAVAYIKKCNRCQR